MEPVHVGHGFGPLIADHATTLILGSFPSIKSREAAFYYGHPQNRFWRIIAAVFDEDLEARLLAGENIPAPATIEEKKQLVLTHHLALYDTIESCTVTGSSDSSIKDVEPADIVGILKKADITRILCNGATSYNLFQKYETEPIKDWAGETGRPAPEVLKLPSTSPANAAWSLKRLYPVWKEALTK